MKTLLKHSVHRLSIFLLVTVSIISCNNPLQTHEIKEHNIVAGKEEYCVIEITSNKDNGKLNVGDKLCILCGPNNIECPSGKLFYVKVKEGSEFKKYEVTPISDGALKCESCPEGVILGFEKVD